MPDLTDVLDLVSAAIQCESDREHENTWNEDIHKALIKLALGTSHYAQRLAVKSLYVPPERRVSVKWTLTRTLT